jgi:DNA modification methylase
MYVPLRQVVPAVRNPKAHDKAGITRSIQRFGFAEPVLMDERTGRLIAGHGRTEVLADMRDGGDEPPAGIRLDGDGDWLVPVVHGWSSRSDVEAEALLVADNRLTELGGWDDGALLAILDELAASDPDLVAIAGYSTDDHQALMAGLRTGAAVQNPDDVPDAPAAEDARSVLGDLWVLGDHRLVVGDSTDPSTVDRLMAGGPRADIIFTDPPYGMAYGGGRGKARPAFDMIEGDELVGARLVGLVRDSLAIALGHCNPDSAVYVCHTWRTHTEFGEALQANGLTPKSCIVWDKGCIGLGFAHYRPQHEFIYYVPGQWYGDKAQSDVWTVSRDGTSGYTHPTQKPVELVGRALANSSEAGGTVLDPFAGSGSTLIAAHGKGMTARVVELEPRYADVICLRYQNATGELPVHEGTGEPVDFAV